MGYFSDLSIKAEEDESKRRVGHWCREVYDELRRNRMTKDEYLNHPRWVATMRTCLSNHPPQHAVHIFIKDVLMSDAQLEERGYKPEYRT